MMTVEINFFAMRTILIVGFDLIKNLNSYLYQYYFCFELTQFNIFVVSGLRIKHSDNHN